MVLSALRPTVNAWMVTANAGGALGLTMSID